MGITDKELLILQDTDFLLTKATVLEKINELLGQTREELKESVENSNFSFPDRTYLLNGKISKGENYKNLPFMVLDYPALFTTKTVFAYRTMFWWGIAIILVIVYFYYVHKVFKGKVDDIDYH